MERIYSLFLVLVCLLLVKKSEAQVNNVTDTTLVRPDTAVVKQSIPDSATVVRQPVVKIADTTGVVLSKQPFEPNPKKAGMYSALLPGAGQLYNRQYWKIPVIYAGVATVAYFIKMNSDNYNDYHTAYVNRISHPYATDKYTGIYSVDNLKTLQDDYKKYLDLTVLAAGVGYILQVLDAVVYAYLKNFDVSRDISFHMRTVPTQTGATVGFVMNFK